MIGKNKDGSWKRFEDLSEEEIKEICNGCGVKGGWISPPHAIFFRASCNHHDYGYWKGGDADDRKNCDLKFKEAMIEDCKRGSWYEYFKYRPWCEVYYIGVRLCGAKYFNYYKVGI